MAAASGGYLPIGATPDGGHSRSPAVMVDSETQAPLAKGLKHGA